MKAELELHRRFARTRSIAHVPLADLPTPVRRLDALARELGVAQLWVKNDGLTCPTYGGNKIRKLEFLLAHAQAQGRRGVWTVGAIGSHHVLATSLMARSLDLVPKALHFPQPLTDHVQEVLLALSTAKPDLELAGSKNTMPLHLLKKRIAHRLEGSAGPYYIPGGGSAPRGVLGYVNAALELARQIDDGHLPMPDVIYVTMGSCGTLAGLVLGCALAELPCRIVGVRVVDRLVANATLTASLANRAGRLLADAGIDVPRISKADFDVVHDQFGPGYGVPTEAGETAMELARAVGELELDPTYTAKTFAAIMQRPAQSAPSTSRILYWHTLSQADLTPLLDDADPSVFPTSYQSFLNGTHG